MLKRLLLLALLLDIAAEHPGRPAGAPLLFRRGQPLKSTAAAVAQLLAGRLRGEAATALLISTYACCLTCTTVASFHSPAFACATQTYHVTSASKIELLA